MTEAWQKYHRRKAVPNLTPLQTSMVNSLRNDRRYRVLSSDKGCGQALMDTEVYTERSVSDHLSDSKVYKRLSKREAIGHTRGVARIIEEFIDNHKDALSDPEYIYLKEA